MQPVDGRGGKGHLVKEIDALGGAMGIATDEAGIQFRTLNSSKGPAVRATRVQADRVLYKALIRTRLENQPNLTLFQQGVETSRSTSAVPVACERRDHANGRDVRIRCGGSHDRDFSVRGDPRWDGTLRSRARGGPPARTLGARLRELALPAGRLKTGTPPRLDGRTVDFSVLGNSPATSRRR